MNLQVVCLGTFSAMAINKVRNKVEGQVIRGVVPSDRGVVLCNILSNLSWTGNLCSRVGGGLLSEAACCVNCSYYYFCIAVTVEQPYCHSPFGVVVNYCVLHFTFISVHCFSSVY